MITETISYLNEYNNGFEATIGVNETTNVVELDLTYVAGGETTEESIGICMPIEAARRLADRLYDACRRIEGENW